MTSAARACVVRFRWLRIRLLCFHFINQKKAEVPDQALQIAHVATGSTELFFNLCQPGRLHLGLSRSGMPCTLKAPYLTLQLLRTRLCSSELGSQCAMISLQGCE